MKKSELLTNVQTGKSFPVIVHYGQTAAPRPVFWIGSRPNDCDHCRAPLRGVMMIGPLKGRGSQPFSTHAGCHRIAAIRGSGVEYRLRPDGRWLRTLD